MRNILSLRINVSVVSVSPSFEASEREEKGKGVGSLFRPVKNIPVPSIFSNPGKHPDQDNFKGLWYYY